MAFPRIRRRTAADKNIVAEKRAKSKKSAFHARRAFDKRAGGVYTERIGKIFIPQGGDAMEEMKAHERFIAAAMGQPFDRLPLLEWAGWWDLTRKRWAKERPETEKMEIWGLHRYWT